MRTRVLLIVLGAGALVLGAVVLIYVRRSHDGSASQTRQLSPTSGTPKTPSALADPKWAKGQRVTVEVLNATKVRGLARRASRALRDQGFDVVSTGTNREQFDTTQVLDRTGHRDWAVLAAKAMGGGSVLVRPDSSREVDLTVLIGTTWHPPSQPFYP